MNYLGRFIQQKLCSMEISEREMAKKCNISHSYLNQLIKGTNPTTSKPISPTILTLEKLSRGFKIPVSDLQKIASGTPEEALMLENEEGRNKYLQNIEHKASSTGIPVGSNSDRVIPWDVWEQFKQAQSFISSIGLDPSEYDETAWKSLLQDISLVIKLHNEKLSK